ncbi:MAG: PEP-CTERM sorting domain-containing protein [Syntrophobacteraceae bacterium]
MNNGINSNRTRRGEKMKEYLIKWTGILLMACAVLAIGAPGVHATSFTSINLGVVDTDDLGILVTGGSGNNLTVTGGSSTFNANIGFVTGSATSFTGGTHTVTGSTYTGLTSPGLTQAIIGGLTANQTIGSIGGNTTINPSTTNANSYGGYNTVVDITGGFNLSSGQTLTITGTSSDYYIIYEEGAMSVNGASVLLSGGLTASNVLFFVAGTDGISGNNSVLYGTYYSLAPITFSGGTVDGALIGSKITASSSTGQTDILNGGDPYNYGSDAPSSVPEPGTMLLLGSGLVGLGVFRKRFKKA